MGRKRAIEDEAGPSNINTKRPAPRGQQQQQQDGPPPAAADRRGNAAELARRRAAHFATWQAADDDEDDPNINNNDENPHIGGEAARSLGPWSTAVQLANARERQRQRRDEKLRDAAVSPSQGQGEGGTKGEKGGEGLWSPSRDLKLGPRPVCEVAPLLGIALDLVVEYIEDVESLYGLPDMVKTRIAAAVCQCRAMNAQVFKLFCDNMPSEVCIPDCSQLEPADVEEGMLEAWSPRLQKLSLGLCGRGFTDATAEKLSTSGASLPTLHTLHLSGGYRLGDAALSSFLKKTPALLSLSLPQFSRLQGSVIQALPASTPLLEELDLRDCRGIGAETLKTALCALPKLKSLTLDCISEVDDALVESIARTADSLERISLRLCPLITDAALLNLAQQKGTALLAVAVDECKITTAGVIQLAQGCKKLQQVSLKGCKKVDDTAIIALAELGTLRTLHLSTVTQITDESMAALARFCRNTLEEIDISWCRLLSPNALGLLADSCPHLRTVVAWGCSQLNARFLDGHSNDGLAVVGRGEKVKRISLPLQRY